MNTDYINKAFHHYLICALWSSTNSAGEPLDSYLDVTDFDDIDMTEHKDELISFVTKAWTMLVDNQIKAEQCGHDFWLTRAGHGAGFWSRGYGEDGDKLTALCNQFGDADITQYFSDPYDNSVEEMNSIPTRGEYEGNVPSHPNYADGEVLGLDHGYVVQWNAEDKESYVSGETLEEFGIENLTEKELKRLFQ